MGVCNQTGRGGLLTDEKRAYATQVEGEANELRLEAPSEEAQKLWGDEGGGGGGGHPNMRRVWVFQSENKGGGWGY